MKGRTIVTALAFAALAAAALFASGGTEQAPAAAVPAGKPATWIADGLKLSMLYFEDARTPYNPKWPWVPFVKERTGVDMEIIPVPSADFAAKSRVMISSGDPPDMVTRADYFFYEFFNDGVWVPISDYWSVMPNFKRAAAIVKAEAAIEEFKEADGKFYNLPEFRGFTTNNLQLFYRNDLMKKYGLEPAKKTEELLPILKKIAAGEGGKNKGFGFVDKLGALGSATGRWFNDVSCYGGSLNQENCFDRDSKAKKWVFGPTADKARAAVELLAALYKEGLFDTECLTIPREQFRTRLSNGIYGAVVCYYSDTEVAAGAGKKVLGPDFMYMWALPPESPYGRAYTTGSDGKWQYMTTMTTRGQKRHGKDYEKVMKFVDWLRYSEETWTLYNYGILGESYDIVDGKPKLRPHIKSVDNPAGTVEMEKTYGGGVMPFRGYTPPEREMRELPPDYQKFQWDTVKLGYIETMRKKVVFKAAEQDIINQYIPSLKLYIDEMATKVILGQVPLNDKTWEEFKKGCEQRGSKKLEEIYAKVVVR